MPFLVTRATSLTKIVALAGVVAATALVVGCGTAPSRGTPPAPREPARFSYGPFNESYAIVVYTRQELPLGGQITVIEYSVRWRMTAATDPSGGEAGLTMTIDSTTPGATPLAGYMAGAVGTTFVGTLSAEGRVEDLRGGDTTNVWLSQWRAWEAVLFFPRVPAGGAAPGQQWTDTLSTTTSSGGQELHLEFVSRSQAAGWMDRDGVRALEVATVTDYTLVGSRSQMRTMEGTGSRRGIAYLAADGRFLGGTSADTSTVTVTVADTGMMNRIVQMRLDSVTVVHTPSDSSSGASPPPFFHPQSWSAGSVNQRRQHL